MAATPSITSAEEADQPAPSRLAGSWPAWEAPVLAVIVGVALLLRLNAYERAPFFTDNLDEIQFTWAGLNLILHHDPYTWAYSGYSSYTPLRAFGVTVPMVHHWMDHPPLFSYIMGGWVYLLGVRDMLAITPQQVRVPPIAFSTLTVPLVHLLGRRFVAPAASLCGAALLATAPGAILLGRQAEPESLQAVLLLIALLLTLRAVEGSAGPWSVAGLLGCCLAAPLLKVPGVAVAGICGVILVAHGRWRLAAGAAGAAGLALLIFAAYGALIDWAQFVNQWHMQEANRIGVMAGYDFITVPAGLNRRLRDGWWILGWIGFALLLGARGGRRRELFLVWPAVAYAATMLVLAGERLVEQYGWYRLIIYPELYLAAGYVAWEAVSRRSPALLALLLVLGGATATNWWLGGPDAAWVPSPVLLVLVFAAVLAPALLAAWQRERPDIRTWALGAAGAALALIVLGNVVESLWLDRIFVRL